MLTTLIGKGAALRSVSEMASQHPTGKRGYELSLVKGESSLRS